MKPHDIFSVRDFFHYYFPGILWILDFLAIYLLLAKVYEWEVTLSDIISYFDNTNIVFMTIVSIIAPYFVGFVLNPVSTKSMEKIRNRYNEAIHWVTDPKHKWASQGLKEWEKETIQAKMREIYNLRGKNFDEFFFTIRAFVEEYSKGAGSLAVRTLDLTNFAESIVIPLPLLFIIFGLFFLVSKSLWVVFFIGIGILVFFLTLNRYLALRSYWVKHVYRAFIAITAQKPKSD